MTPDGPVSSQDLRRLLEFLRERTGLVFPATRLGEVHAAAQAALRRVRAADMDSLLEALQHGGPGVDHLVAQLTVGETYFFREPAHFQFLARTILPDILSRHGDGHVVRAWSAGCASGEEAYSVAMVMRAAGLARHRAHVLATDLSLEALARGRAASYRAWSLRGDGAAQARPFLLDQEGRHVVTPGVRELVRFEYLNLAGDAYPSFTNGTWGLDLVLCRNVLIYFDARTVERVARGLWESLAPGGWLITASSDPPLQDLARYEYVGAPEGFFYRRPPEVGVREPVPPAEDAGAGTLTTALERLAAQLPGAAADALAAAQRALSRGDYAAASRLVQDLGHADPGACALRIRLLANTGDLEAAAALAQEEAARHPLQAEVHFLHTTLLMALGRWDAALEAVRRVLYLDRTLAVAHVVHGGLQEALGQLEGARRAFRVARDLAAALPPTALVPLGDGEYAGRLVALAERQLTILEDGG